MPLGFGLIGGFLGCLVFEIGASLLECGCCGDSHFLGAVLMRGEVLGDRLHRFTETRRPEVVVFGLLVGLNSISGSYLRMNRIHN